MRLQKGHRIKGALQTTRDPNPNVPNNNNNTGIILSIIPVLILYIISYNIYIITHYTNTNSVDT